MENRREFMLMMSTVMASGLVSPLLSAKGAVLKAANQLTNWAENLVFNPRKLALPKTLSELSELVKNASSLKVYGSRHSFNTIAHDQRVQVSLENLPKQVLVVDRDQCLVKMSAQMTLKEANRRLEKLGFSFPVMGEIEDQTLAGLIATATHGSSFHHGTISDLVVELDILNQKGQLQTISEGEELKFYRVNLGALGLVVNITFKLEPLFYLKREMNIVALKDCFDTKLLEKNDYIQFSYVPFTDRAMLLTMNKIDQTLVRYDDDTFSELVMDNTVSNLLLRIASRRPSLVPQIFKRLSKTYRPRKASHVSYKMFTFRRNFKINEMELSINYEDTERAFEIIQQHIEEESQKYGFYWNLPVLARFVKGMDKALLSPTYGREMTTYLSIPSHGAFKNYIPSYQRLEKKIVEELSARPHWGKHFWISPSDKYQEFKSFQQKRDHVDPRGKYLNPYLKKWILKA